MDLVSWTNRNDGLSTPSSAAGTSSSSTSSSFLLITGVRVDNIPEVRKGKVFIVVRAGEKVERTSRIDIRKGSVAWANLKINVTDIDSAIPTTISFELYHDASFFSPKARVLGRAERSFQDFLHPGLHSLFLQLHPLAKRNSARSSAPICTVEFENNVETVAQEIFIPPLYPEPTISQAETVSVFSVSQTFSSVGNLGLLSSGLGKLLDSFEPYAEVLEKVSKIHPAAQVAYFFISSAYTVVKRQHDTDASIIELFQIMMRTYEIASAKDILQSDNTFAKRFKFRDMIRQSIECSLFISGYSSKGYLRRLTTMNVSRKVAEFKTAFEMMEREFVMRLARTTTTATLTIRPSVEFVAIQATLKQMKPVDPLGPRLSCMPGTRRETLRVITNWISQGERSVIWLHGMAGTGKSSLMGSLSDIALEMGISSRLGAFIRFDRFEYSDPAFFVKTLANELASFDDRLGRAIADAVLKRMANHTQLARQFSSLILEPLEMCVDEMKDEGPVVVLVDGVDECQRGPKREELLRLLAGGFGTHLPFVRLVIASRPEEDIKKVLQRNPQIHTIVLDTASAETTEDIRYVINNSLKEIGEDYPEFQEHCEATDAALKLAERASGLFIWASTVLAFIAHLPMERLSVMLSTEVPTSALKALTILYQIALTSLANETGDDDIKSSIRVVLGSIIIASSRSEGISQSILEGVLRYAGVSRVSTLIDKMGSFVSADYDGNLRLLHKSFDDFLMDKERCGEDWAINVKFHRQIFTIACLRRLHAWYDKTQKQDRLMYEEQRAQALAEDPGAQYLDPDIVYSSDTWYRHACMCSDIPQNSSLSNLLARMFEVYFLRWLEDRTGDINRDPLGYTDKLIPPHISFNDDQIIREHLKAFLSAVSAMAYKCKGLAPRFAVYLALLLGVPSRNFFRRRYLKGFHSFATRITSSQVDRLVLSSFGIVGFILNMRSLKLQFHLAIFAAGSPSLIVKNFEGRQWMLVDALTGEIKRVLIIPQSEPAPMQCIESDGFLHLIQRLKYSTVKVLTWNPYRGSSLHSNCKELSTSVEFSISKSETITIYDGMIFASTYGSSSMIRRWDLKTGECHTVSLDTTPVTEGFSLYTDPYCAIFGSQHEGIYHIYNPTDGKCFPESIAAHSPIVCITISADRTRLAIAQSDTTVTIFDFMSLDHITEPCLCFSPIQSICFSPDGLALLVCTETGACILDVREKTYASPAQSRIGDWPPLGSPEGIGNSPVEVTQDEPSTSSHSTEIIMKCTSLSKPYTSLGSKDGSKSLLLLEDGSVLIVRCNCEGINEVAESSGDHADAPLRPSYLHPQRPSATIAYFPKELIERRSAIMSEAGEGKLVRITASEDGVLQASLDFKWAEL